MKQSFNQAILYQLMKSLITLSMDHLSAILEQFLQIQAKFEQQFLKKLLVVL